MLHIINMLFFIHVPRHMEAVLKHLTYKILTGNTFDHEII